MKQHLIMLLEVLPPWKTNRITAFGGMPLKHSVE